MVAKLGEVQRSVADSKVHTNGNGYHQGHGEVPAFAYATHDAGPLGTRARMDRAHLENVPSAARHYGPGVVGIEYPPKNAQDFVEKERKHGRYAYDPENNTYTLKDTLSKRQKRRNERVEATSLPLVGDVFDAVQAEADAWAAANPERVALYREQLGK